MVMKNCTLLWENNLNWTNLKENVTKNIFGPKRREIAGRGCAINGSPNIAYPVSRNIQFLNVEVVFLLERKMPEGSNSVSSERRN
jgi:hypothetical protein